MRWQKTGRRYNDEAFAGEYVICHKCNRPIFQLLENFPKHMSTRAVKRIDIGNQPGSLSRCRSCNPGGQWRNYWAKKLSSLVVNL